MGRLKQGFIIYSGPSVLDGAPIVVIATIKTKNRKTGDVIQIWILREDMPPMEAVNTSADVSICGFCPRRHALGGNCYVIPWQAPTSIYNCYKRGGYTTDVEPADLAGYIARVGAYGDPAAVPAEVWDTWLEFVDNVLSYTHQTRMPGFDPAILGFSQASADTLQQAKRFWRDGVKTYRVLNHLEQPEPEETMCPSLEGVTCADCGGCNGKTANYAIPAHGAHSDYQKLKVGIIQEAA